MKQGRKEENNDIWKEGRKERKKKGRKEEGRKEGRGKEGIRK